jgi:hypothetical protein
MIQDDLEEVGNRNHGSIDPLYESIKDIIDRLRKTIDELDANSKTAQELILEAARKLDESKQCKQNEICVTIKKLLKDRIDQGKISEKWIEDSLPKEYQRKYIAKSMHAKSEVTSLSKNTSKSGTTSVLLPSSHRDGGGCLGDDCPRCPELVSQNRALREALDKATPLGSASDLSRSEKQKFQIPKEMQRKLIEELNDSIESCYVIFDECGRLLDVQSDTSIHNCEQEPICEEGRG